MLSSFSFAYINLNSWSEKRNTLSSIYRFQLACKLEDFLLEFFDGARTSSFRFQTWPCPTCSCFLWPYVFCRINKETRLLRGKENKIKKIQAGSLVCWVQSTSDVLTEFMFLLALASFNKTQQVLIKERKIEKAKPDIILKLPNTSIILDRLKLGQSNLWLMMVF